MAADYLAEFDAAAPAADLVSAIADRRISAADTLAHAVARAAAADAICHPFLSRRDAAQLNTPAPETDLAGQPLRGVPVAIKDNLCTRDFATTCASRMLAHYKPGWDATAVARLRHAGAVVLGKTNLDEFGMGATTEFSALAHTTNPWNPAYVPGGSSGGAAAAVALGAAPLALGSDTGGSVRVPAAYCGVIGLKPTYGRVSRSGLVAYASSLDCVGVFARAARDAARALQLIAGPDPRDSTCHPAPAPDYLAALAEHILTDRAATLRIGLPREYFAATRDDALQTAVINALRALEARGATLVDVSLPDADRAAACYFTIAAAEAASNLARYDGVHFGARAAPAADYHELAERTRTAHLGPEVQRRILLGNYVLSAGYAQRRYHRAADLRATFRAHFARLFDELDLLATPTTPVGPPRIGAALRDPDLLFALDAFTAAASLAGAPALSVPCGFDRAGLPIGLHLIAKPLDEVTLLQAALLHEQNTGGYSFPALPAQPPQRAVENSP